MFFRKIPPPQHKPNGIIIQNTININVHNTFTIYNFATNKSLEIIHRDSQIQYLSANHSHSGVLFEINEDSSGRQKWIFEKDESDPNVYYIRTEFYHKHRVKYLGCPNKSGFIYLYTSKNKYTKWNILSIGDSKYHFKYVGEKFDESNVELVIAKFNEDVEWAMAYNDIAIIYNKGHPVNGFYRMINLENVGREGHTYLYHMSKNYDNIKETTIFLQGDPFLHNETILFGIDNHFLFDNVQPLGLRYLKSCNLPPIEYVESKKTVTNYGLEYLKINADGDLICPDFHDVGVIDFRINSDKEHPESRNKRLVDGFFIRSKFPYKKFIDEIKYSFSGLFSVNKSRILYYSAENYNNMITELIKKNNQGGVNGYILEKSWLYIFENAC